MAANGKISFFYNLVHKYINIYKYTHTHTHMLHLLYSSVDGHLGCFQILTFINNGAMNIDVLICFQISVFIIFFFRYIPRSGIAWKIPWTEEPGGLQSMGSLRVGHD